MLMMFLNALWFVTAIHDETENHPTQGRGPVKQKRVFAEGEQNFLYVSMDQPPFESYWSAFSLLYFQRTK